MFVCYPTNRTRRTVTLPDKIIFPLISFPTDRPIGLYFVRFETKYSSYFFLLQLLLLLLLNTVDNIILLDLMTRIFQFNSFPTLRSSKQVFQSWCRLWFVLIGSRTVTTSEKYILCGRNVSTRENHVDFYTRAAAVDEVTAELCV